MFRERRINYIRMVEAALQVKTHSPLAPPASLSVAGVHALPFIISGHVGAMSEATLRADMHRLMQASTILAHFGR